jgi:hypothetical protein
MGYTITIGELEIEKCPEDGIDSDCLRFGAKGERHYASPSFGEPTDFTNSRWPSYTAWAETMRTAGLHEAMFYGGTLIGGHPGVRLVTPELRDAVSNALAGLRARFPGREPAFDDTDEGCAMARLTWMDYWLRWALANCETPVIANS